MTDNIFLIVGMVGSFALWTIMAAEYENHGQAKQYGIAPDCLRLDLRHFLLHWLLRSARRLHPRGPALHLRAKGVMIMNMTVQAILAISAQTNNVAITQLPKTYDFWIFYTV